METRANHVWVGAVTLVLVGVLAAFIIWLARINDGNQNNYDIFFKQSVDGLAKGSQVTYAGVPAGQVQEIDLWRKDPGFVRVRIQVDEKIPILQGTTAQIQGSFTGVGSILLDGGVRGAPRITEPGPEGAPVIPTKQGGLGALLSNAPLLLERLATLTERLSQMLSDKNQQSIAAILQNTDRLTANVADASPQLNRTMAELQVTLRQASGTLASFERVADSTDRTLNREGASLAQELRATLKTAQAAADELKGAVGDSRPAVRQLTESTLPTVEATLRDLRSTSRALRNITEKLDEQGASALVSGTKLPEYQGK